LICLVIPARRQAHSWRGTAMLLGVGAPLGSRAVREDGRSPPDATPVPAAIAKSLLMPAPAGSDTWLKLACGGKPAAGVGEIAAANRAVIDDRIYPAAGDSAETRQCVVARLRPRL